MLNTLVVCLISIFGNVVFSTMAGYALGRLKWRGRGLVFTMFMGTMVIPIEGVMISQFLIIRSIHLQNTLLAVALPGLCGAINILLMTNAFRSIPMELEEAAMVDGANLWQRFFHICVPQVKGTMTVVGIFAFVGAWNDFLWPTLVFNDINKMPVTAGLQLLSNQMGQYNQMGSLMAATCMAIIPTLLLFLFAQKYFLQSLNITSGLKG